MRNRILRFAASTSLATAALLAIPAVVPMAMAHVGHGDEFQNQGTVRQVKANAESDALLGVQTTKPETGPDGLTVPSTAVVDADGKPVVFVKTATTYDPVLVQTGSNLGDRVVISSGLDPTDDVVTAGALSLYAESKKTQQAEEPAKAAEADVKAGAAAESNNTMPVIAAAGGAAVLVAGAAALLSRRGKQGE